MRLTRFAFLLAGILLPARSFPQDVPWEFDGVTRIVAIGDVHGAYERFVATLRATDLVDKKNRWTGGKAHLVQTGDVVDRGPESRKAMDLLMTLEKEAEAAGGRVHALIGNHDFWNVVGELFYVSPKEFAAFDGERDRELRVERGATGPAPGFFAHREAFGPSGIYGRFIRGHNAVVKINGIVFVHGGITPRTAAIGLAEINRQIRAELDSGEQWKQGLSSADDGPLLTRRYSEENLSFEVEKQLTPEVEAVLQQLGAKAVVMGHTVTYGLITPRFGGRAYLIDTGMLDIYMGGRQAVLVIERGRALAVYSKGKVEIPESLEGDAGAKYVEASVASSPDDVALRQSLANARLRQGRYKDASDLYFKLGVFDPQVMLPYAWRREAALSFKAIGEPARAEKLFRLYLEGLGTYARRSGGAPFLHAYVRECLELGFLQDDALSVARQLSAAQPNNPQYRVTLGWAYLEQGDAARAADVIRAAIRDGGDGFDAQFQLGRAYARLDDTAQATEAFRRALVFKPGSREAQDAIHKLGVSAK